MATSSISIINHSFRPDTSGKCWREPYSILATNDAWPFAIIRIDENNSNNTALTTKAGFYGRFRVPDNYASGPGYEITWTATGTTGDSVFDIDLRTVGGNDTTSMDQAGTEATLTVTDTAPGAAHRRLTATVSDGTATYAAGEEVEYYVACDGVDAADTIAFAKILFDVRFTYTTT